VILYAAGATNAGGRARVNPVLMRVSVVLTVLLVACGGSDGGARDADDTGRDAVDATADGDTDDAGSEVGQDAEDVTADVARDAPDVDDADADAGDVPDLPDLPDLPDMHPDAPDEPCVSTVTVALERTTASRFFWEGEDARVDEIAAVVDGDACAAIEATTDKEWLRAAFDRRRSRLTVWLATGAVVSGRHSARVTLHDGDDEAALAFVDVQLAALVRAPEAAPRKALVIGIDGLRADGLAVAQTPNAELMMRRAAWTLDASTQLEAPTSSGPGWTSIVTGVDANKHNIRGNSGYGNRDRAWPTLLWRLRQQHGLRTAAAIHWSPILNDIMEPDAVDDGVLGNDEEVTVAMVEMLGGDYDAHFIHLDDVDHAGHASGFSPDNPAYLAAIEVIDALVGRLLNAIVDRPDVAQEEWIIVLTADHGGDPNGHGGLTPQARRIPLIVSGASTVSGDMRGFVSHMDVLPTVCAFMGLHPDASWELDGHVVGLGIESACGDGIDEDGDGHRDCDDEDCSRSTLCGFFPDELVCNDGVDNDQDGDLDCADDDCQGNPACDAECVASDLARSLGTVVQGVGTANAGSDWQGSCGGDDAPELLFNWAAPATDTYVFDTVDSTFDTVLYVREGDCTGAELGCNDKMFGSVRLDTPIPFQSALRLDLTEGDGVTIGVDGSNALAVGDAHLRITPVGGTCPETEGADLEQPLTGTTTNAPTRFFASCAGSARDHTVTFTATHAGEWTFDTLESDFDTVLFVLDAACGGEEIACNDDAQGLQSRVEVGLEMGQTITIVVSGFRGRNGEFALRATPPGR
jgi:hypothetical protein